MYVNVHTFIFSKYIYIENRSVYLYIYIGCLKKPFIYMIMYTSFWVKKNIDQLFLRYKHFCIFYISALWLTYWLLNVYCSVYKLHSVLIQFPYIFHNKRFHPQSVVINWQLQICKKKIARCVYGNEKRTCKISSVNIEIKFWQVIFFLRLMWHVEASKSIHSKS